MTTTPGPRCRFPSVHPYAEHDGRVAKHYAHAREKHPYFCDVITRAELPDIQQARKYIQEANEAGYAVCDVRAVNLITDKLMEILESHLKGDTARAVERCYDAIAILLRTIDVLEGRQKLGKPENESI